MRKTLLLVAAGLVLALTGCGGDDEEAGTTTAATGGADAIRIGLVADQGQLNDRGFNQLAYEA